MTSNDIQQVKDDLNCLLADLSRNSTELLGQWANISENFPDEIDKAMMHAEMDFAFTRLFREGVSKENIMRALRKIDDGTYGICEQCEEEISAARLKAVPDARYCVACQEALEKEWVGA